jgi:uncharacterized protein
MAMTISALSKRLLVAMLVAAGAGSVGAPTWAQASKAEAKPGDKAPAKPGDKTATKPSAPAGMEPHGGATAPPPAFLNGLPEKQGYLAWRTLADVSVKREKDRMVPTYSKQVSALNNKEVKIEGFMIPLDPSTPKEQKHFVLTAMPQSCSFCLPPVGMEGIVEVKTTKPVPVTIEPVRISGKLNVLTDDPMGLYYRITEAQPVK